MFIPVDGAGYGLPNMLFSVAHGPEVGYIRGTPIHMGLGGLGILPQPILNKFSCNRLEPPFPPPEAIFQDFRCSIAVDVRNRHGMLVHTATM